jgi:hypothetical protein
VEFQGSVGVMGVSAMRELCWEFELGFDEERLWTLLYNIYHIKIAYFKIV